MGTSNNNACTHVLFVFVFQPIQCYEAAYVYIHVVKF